MTTSEGGLQSCKHCGDYLWYESGSTEQVRALAGPHTPEKCLDRLEAEVRHHELRMRGAQRKLDNTRAMYAAQETTT